MIVQIKAVESAKEVKKFINFEYSHNKNTPHWIATLRSERHKMFNKEKNPFFKKGEMQLFLAYDEGKLVGRIAAILNRTHNDFYNDKIGFWGFFEAVDDKKVSNALFNAAGKWLSKKGMETMRGPANPTINDEIGLLIDGFDTKPYMLTTHNKTYYPKLVEAYGFEKAKDLYGWHVSADTALESITPKMMRVSEKALGNEKVNLRNLQFKDLDKEVEILRDIFNDAWSQNWGFVPFSVPEFTKTALSLKPVVDEELTFLAEIKDAPVGFSITLPNLNEIFEKIPNGRLFPFGFLKLIFGLKKIKTARTFVLGIKQGHHFMGLGSLFYINTIKAARKKGIKEAEMSWILEDNDSMNKAIEALGARIYKTWRVYDCDL